ncbi:hypothetical protein CLIB1444_01S15610 [[Candida] jaroonii]|uniref:Uncharacterized protein n=1 Tax=[Candida] jaroonii TaxID=467808 RepID=A0ACA9Y1K6_9ASCO|nr:hypothetical protein CLIB1444_01S15610 [[Candida] jaroonii]
MFNRFLESRGIKRIYKEETAIEEYSTPDNDEIFDFLSLERIGDSDLFYNQRRESFNNDLELEEDTNDVGLDMLEYVEGYRRPFLDSKVEELLTSYEYLSTKRGEPLNDISEGTDDYILETSDISKLIRKDPAEKFNDSLQLKYLGNEILSHFENSRKYKNNLSTIITIDSDYLVTAINSEICIYGFGINFIPQPKPVVKFDTKPLFTTTTDRLISTWPYFPHTINYLRQCTWLGIPSLALCIDDGGLIIYNLSTISQAIDSSEPVKKVKEDFRLKLESSVWGVDFFNYGTHNIIATADNSQSLTLFYYHEQDQRFYHVKTHQILHNIPDCSILSYNIEDEFHIIKVSCVSISSELIIFQFKFKLIEGPLNDHPDLNTNVYYIDPSIQSLESVIELENNRFKRIYWFQPTVINRSLLTEDCWTINPIAESQFKSVNSLGEVFGDEAYNEDLERIMNESSIFGKISNKNLGLCKDWQYFRIPTVSFDNLHRFQKLTTIDDDYRRLNKMFKKSTEIKNRAQNELYLVVTTSKKISLFNSSLFCNCSSGSIFNLEIPSNEESKFSNRISLTKVIPELSAIVCVSQQGLVSVFRLCEYRGIKGMRQEYIFPNAIGLSLGFNGFRTISGISVRNISVNDNLQRFLLYIIYSDGLILTYQLSDQLVNLSNLI